MGDVVALHTPRGRGQAEILLQLGQGSLDGVGAVQPLDPMLGQALGSVGGHHVHELAIFATLRAIHANRATPPAAQEILQKLGVLFRRVMLHQDDGRHFQGGGIELLNELGDDLAGLAVLWTLHKEMITADELAAPDEKHLDPSLVRGDGNSDCIQIGGASGIDLDGAFFFELLDGGHLVAQGGGSLKLQLFGGRLHLFPYLTCHCFGVAFQEQDHLLDHLGILILGGQAGAGAHAAMDVILKAGPRVGAGNPLGAGTVWEQLLDQVH